MSDAKQLPVELMDPKSLKPYAKNTKIHTDEQVEKIAASIREFGFDQPIVVDSDHVVIKGHGRRLASIKLGLKKVPTIIRTDLSDEQVRALRIADNKVAEGDHDVAMLEEELRDLMSVDLDFDMGDFMEERDLDFLTVDLGEIDVESVSEDLANEVEERTTKTSENLSGEDERAQSVAKVLNIKSFSGVQARTIRRFMSLLEGEDPAQALVLHAESVLGGAQ